MLNPYASFLNGRDPLEVTAATPSRLRELTESLGTEGLERSLGPGKWNARSILCHLADTEIAFAFRIRQALAEPNHLIQPFDQDIWARPYAQLDASQAVGLFTALREWNLALVRTVPEEEMSRTLTHPERGEMTFRTLIETMGGHDLNHLSQLETVAHQAN